MTECIVKCNDAFCLPQYVTLYFPHLLSQEKHIHSFPFYPDKSESKETLQQKNATEMYSATYSISHLVLSFQVDTEISYAY